MVAEDRHGNEVERLRAGGIGILNGMNDAPVRVALEESSLEESRRGGGWSPARLALAVWLCALPFVFLLVAPVLGAWVAIATAFALLAGLFFVCWTLCVWGRSEASGVSDCELARRSVRREAEGEVRTRETGPANQKGRSQ